MLRFSLRGEPFAPYAAEEMWEELGRPAPVFRQKWPAFDPELASARMRHVLALAGVA